MSALRLLPFATQAGSWNMAADEVLLRGAAGGVAALRFYGWETATVSLGYFQEAAPVRDHPRLGTLPLVRRASGGAALVHHHEITYALALPAAPPWQDRREGWLRKMHGIIRTALAGLGVVCTPSTQDRLLGPILCFLHHTPEDLLVGECKVVGSAQRKQRDALMQHGGILLAQSPHTPELPGIREATGRPVDPVALQDAVTTGLAGLLGCDVRPDDWGDAERLAILEIAAERYQSPDWNLRR
jgi:lipoate-protein ligase A